MNAHFGLGSGLVLFSYTACNGDEATILQCGNSGLFNHTCSHGRDVGVTCDLTPTAAGEFSLSSLVWRSKNEISLSCQGVALPFRVMALRHAIMPSWYEMNVQPAHISVLAPAAQHTLQLHIPVCEVGRLTFDMQHSNVKREPFTCLTINFVHKTSTQFN